MREVDCGVALSQELLGQQGDGAVDPRPEDHCAPVNTGKPGQEGNPHGPNVVSVHQSARPPRRGERNG